MTNAPDTNTVILMELIKAGVANDTAKTIMEIAEQRDPVIHACFHSWPHRGSPPIAQLLASTLIEHYKWIEHIEQRDTRLLKRAVGGSISIPALNPSGKKQ
jgi:hypothetical protein